MTREKAIQVDHLLNKIEAYETLRDEILNSESLAELRNGYHKEGIEIEKALIAVIDNRLNYLMKELEDM